jgi:hypothetical protein
MIRDRRAFGDIEIDHGHLSSTNSIRCVLRVARLAADATKIYINETSVAVADDD